MHERMAAIGGTLQIRTSPGRGVIIRAVYFQHIEETGAIASIPQIAPLPDLAAHEAPSILEEARS
jgi:hypothetical protein